jgi:hypothetical protein
MEFCVDIGVGKFSMNENLHLKIIKLEIEKFCSCMNTVHTLYALVLLLGLIDLEMNNNLFYDITSQITQYIDIVCKAVQMTFVSYFN